MLYPLSYEGGEAPMLSPARTPILTVSKRPGFRSVLTP